MSGLTTVASPDLAPEVAAELTELADVVERLDGVAWDAPSLCAGWRVREVVAHITMPVRWSVPGVAGQMLRARFRWDVVADRIARRDAALPVDELIGALRSERLQGWRPPGGGVEGALVHAVVHGLDITVPLDICRPLPPERMRAVLDALARPATLKHFGVETDGLTLQTSDLDWTHGSGRGVAMEARDMALFLTGRQREPSTLR